MPLIEITVRYRTPEGEIGTDIPFPDAVYRFRPDDQGRHVALVEDEAHLAVLLAADHFVEVHDMPEPAPEPAPEPEDERPPAGTPEPEPAPQQDQPRTLAEMTIEELRTIHLAEIGTAAHARTGAPTLIARIEDARRAKGQDGAA